MDIANEFLLQRILQLEAQMQQVRSKSIDEAAIKVKIGSFTCPAATGYYSVTGVGFKPRAVDFTASLNIGSYIRFGIGRMDYSGKQMCIAIGVTAAGACYTKQYTDNCIMGIDSAGANEVLASYISMNATGFTVTFSVVNSAYTIGWKAVR